MSRKSRVLSFGWALLVTPLFAFTALGADVVVRLVGFAESKGVAHAALFATAESYAEDDSLQGETVTVSGNTVEMTFSGLKPGTYGISAFHDLNENDEIDTNFIGMPTEPYGFSNNARGKFGPPTFEDFSFRVGDESLTIEISLE